MTPSSHTYFDYYQADPDTEPLALGGFLQLEKVYSFDPIPPELNEQESRHILGVQGQLWTENIPNIRHLEYMAWPRLAALAEVGWSARKELETLEPRLQRDLERLTALGVNFRPLGGIRFVQVGSWSLQRTAEEWSELEWDLAPLGIRSDRLKVRFSWAGGSHGLQISRVELLQDGKVVSQDEHAGYAGWHSKDSTYVLDFAADLGGDFRIRASVLVEAQGDSNGEVYVATE
jgi:hexosaminidase